MEATENRRLLAAGLEPSCKGRMFYLVNLHTHTPRAQVPVKSWWAEDREEMEAG